MEGCRDVGMVFPGHFSHKSVLRHSKFIGVPEDFDQKKCSLIAFTVIQDDPRLSVNLTMQKLLNFLTPKLIQPVAKKVCFALWLLMCWRLWK